MLPSRLVFEMIQLWSGSSQMVDDGRYLGRQAKRKTTDLVWATVSALASAEYHISGADFADRRAGPPPPADNLGERLVFAA